MQYPYEPLRMAHFVHADDEFSLEAELYRQLDVMAGRVADPRYADKARLNLVFQMQGRGEVIIVTPKIITNPVRNFLGVQAHVIVDELCVVLDEPRPVEARTSDAKPEPLRPIEHAEPEWTSHETFRLKHIASVLPNGDSGGTLQTTLNEAFPRIGKALLDPSTGDRGSIKVVFKLEHIERSDAVGIRVSAEVTIKMPAPAHAAVDSRLVHGSLYCMNEQQLDLFAKQVEAAEAAQKLRVITTHDLN